MSNNSNYYNKNQFRQEDLVKELTSTAVPMSLASVKFKITTPDFCRKIVDVIAEDFGIPEIDSAFTFPIKGKNGLIEDFDMVLYFICDNTSTNIAKIGGKNQGNVVNRGGNGSVDLRRFLGNKTVSGGFETSETFKNKIGSIARLNHNGDIVIKADPDDRRIAVVDVDFWKVMSIALSISSKSNYDFTITACTPLNNKDSCIDYMLEIDKELDVRERRSKKSKINYEERNRRLMRGNR